MSKACQDSDIPSGIIKENADIFTDILHSSFNNSIYQSEFPSILKLANITPVFKKGDRNSKENYRPVSILSNISKIFERCMFRQISSFMDSYLSKQQCGFRKDYSPQYCLLVMLEKWKNAIDKGKRFGALLTLHYITFPRTVDSETTSLWLRLAGTKTCSKLPVKQKTKGQN